MAAEQIRAARGHSTQDEVAEGLIEKLELPAAMQEFATAVFVRVAGRLHDAVEGQELGDDELGHGSSHVSVGSRQCLLEPRAPAPKTMPGGSPRSLAARRPQVASW
jgi:hypothetical protein